MSPPTHTEPGLTASGLAPDQFKLAFRNHPAGVCVISADAGDGPAALTATSVFSVSAQPPLLVFAIADDSSSAVTVRNAASVVVHLLSAEQLGIAQLCATRGADRFADADLWARLPTGEPYLPSAPAWIRGGVVGRTRAGTSTVLTVHALDAKLPEGPADPLVYHNRAWHTLKVIEPPTP